MDPGPSLRRVSRAVPELSTSESTRTRSDWIRSEDPEGVSVGSSSPCSIETETSDEELLSDPFEVELFASCPITGAAAPAERTRTDSTIIETYDFVLIVLLKETRGELEHETTEDDETPESGRDGLDPIEGTDARETSREETSSSSRRSEFSLSSIDFSRQISQLC